jgi:hypothetical protein
MYSIVNAWIDTLVLNGKGKLPEQADTQLHALQQQAKLAGENMEDDSMLTPWHICGQPLYIRSFGGGHGWRYKLFTHTQDVRCDVGTGRLNENVLKLRLGSLLLHSSSLYDLLDEIQRFAMSLLGIADPISLQVSEVDLCVDIAGWELTGEDAERFVSRGSLHETPEEEHVILPMVDRRGRRIKEFAFCRSAPHSCVIYDKTREVIAHQKQWFYDIWQANGWDGQQTVTRVEFRYKRECLREMGIESPEEMIEKLDAMWQYSCQNWLRHTTPVQDGNRWRWPPSEVWELVQGVVFTLQGANPLLRSKRVQLDIDRILAGFVGYGTGLAARSVILHDLVHQARLQGIALPPPITDLPISRMDAQGKAFLEWVAALMQTYLEEKKHAPFHVLVSDKRTKLIQAFQKIRERKVVNE